MVFFYRRFLPLDVFIYAFGAENDASSSNLPIPFIKTGSMKSAFGGINLTLSDEIHLWWMKSLRDEIQNRDKT